jgi:hypothetical protein
VSLPRADVAESIRRYVAANVLQAYGAVLGVALFKKKGGELYVRCPFHEDEHLSLRINPTKHVWRCDPCDIGGDIFTLFGRMRGLEDFRSVVGDLARCLGVNGHANRSIPREASKPRVKVASLTNEPTSVHMYTDEAGAPWIEVRRYDRANGEKDYFPYDPVATRYFSEKNDHPLPKRRPLYNLKGLTERAGDEVVFVEGEKCADALTRLGYLATTTLGGAKALAKADLQPLRLRPVILWPDNDDDGLSYTTEAAVKLLALGCTLRKIEVPEGKPRKWDAADATPEEIRALIASATALSDPGGGDPLSAALDAAPNQESMTGGQYVQPDGALVHVVPLADGKVVLAASNGSIALEERKVKPTRSTFSRDGVKRFRAGETIALGDVIDRVHALLTAHVRFPRPWQARLTAVWVVGTFLHSLFRFFGYLHITSPTKRCGKSLLLEMLGALSFNATGISTEPSPAFLFRDCARNSSTQIFDEVDRMGEGDKETRAALMAILNAGFKNGCNVPRVVDARHDVLREFLVYSPKALAGLATLAGTTRDRTVRIELARKRGGDRLPRFGARQQKEADVLRDDLHIAALRHAHLVQYFFDKAEKLALPDGLDDRLRDILEPLFAVAAVADAELGARTNTDILIQAAKEIASGRAEDEGEEEALVAVLAALKEAIGKQDHIVLTSADALDLFKRPEGLEWVIELQQARRLLRRCGFRSGTHRRDGEPGPVRGYRIERDALEDLLSRYACDQNRYNPLQPAPNAAQSTPTKTVTSEGCNG